jgi:hypothetical protein
MGCIVKDHSTQMWDAWADDARRDYLGSFDTEAEAEDAVGRAKEFDNSEDAYERCVLASAETRRLFGYP